METKTITRHCGVVSHSVFKGHTKKALSKQQTILFEATESSANVLSLHKLCKYGGYESQFITALSLEITGFRRLTMATNDNAKITLWFQTGNTFRVWLYPGRLIILQMRLVVSS